MIMLGRSGDRHKCTRFFLAQFELLLAKNLLNLGCLRGEFSPLICSERITVTLKWFYSQSVLENIGLTLLVPCLTGRGGGGTCKEKSEKAIRNFSNEFILDFSLPKETQTHRRASKWVSMDKNLLWGKITWSWRWPWLLMLAQIKPFAAVRVGGVRCDFDGSNSIIQWNEINRDLDF